MGYFRGFYEKKYKKIDTYFGNHVHQNAQSNFKCLSSQPKLGQNQHFFEGKMTGNLQGNDHSFHLTSWTHILAKKWLPQRGKWKKIHFSKNHQFFSYFDQPSNMAQNLGSKGFPRCQIGLGGLVKVHRKCLDGFYNI